MAETLPKFYIQNTFLEESLVESRKMTSWEMGNEKVKAPGETGGSALEEIATLEEYHQIKIRVVRNQRRGARYKSGKFGRLTRIRAPQRTERKKKKRMQGSQNMPPKTDEIIEYFEPDR